MNARSEKFIQSVIEDLYDEGLPVPHPAWMYMALLRLIVNQEAVRSTDWTDLRTRSKARLQAFMADGAWMRPAAPVRKEGIAA